jgi:flagellar biosynthesis protein FliP
LNVRQLLGGLSLALLSPLVWASDASDLQGLAELGNGLAQGTELATPLKYMLLFTAMSFIPAFLVAATSFTRIIIVLSMLRTALGLQSTPPNSVLLILALFLTLFSMRPVTDEIMTTAFTPYQQGNISGEQAFERGLNTIRQFVVHNTGEREMATILAISNRPEQASIDKQSIVYLIPAYMLSELKIAFQMGLLVFVPFILIDLIVASILMGLGMMMVPPMTISLPLKIIIFVLSDGWLVLIRSLVASIHP